MEDINQLLQDIELAVERGKAQQLHDMEHGNSNDARTMNGRKYSLQTAAMDVSSSEGQGLPDQVTDMNAPSERGVVAL